MKKHFIRKGILGALVKDLTPYVYEVFVKPAHMIPDPAFDLIMKDMLQNSEDTYNGSNNNDDGAIR
ncbi:hypothetical protein A2U01_0022488, partial [Trifolium medium]|nr:hypothetical protein [Trifolium medium]